MAERRFTKAEGGFTLTELLAVLAAVGLLALVALPAFAGARIKGARALCGGNLHQIFVSSLVYAEEFSTKLPPWRAGFGTEQDDMSQGQYSRWVYYSSTPYEKVPMNFSVPSGDAFENMG
jgi:prepilin-type N-terminal cleavage/methylation domain-containing protein